MKTSESSPNTMKEKNNNQDKTKKKVKGKQRGRMHISGIPYPQPIEFPNQ